MILNNFWSNTIFLWRKCYFSILDKFYVRQKVMLWFSERQEFQFLSFLACSQSYIPETVLQIKHSTHYKKRVEYELIFFFWKELRCIFMFSKLKLCARMCVGGGCVRVLPSLLQTFGFIFVIISNIQQQIHNLNMQSDLHGFKDFLCLRKSLISSG